MTLKKKAGDTLLDGNLEDTVSEERLKDCLECFFDLMNEQARDLGL